MLVLERVMVVAFFTSDDLLNIIKQVPETAPRLLQALVASALEQRHTRIHPRTAHHVAFPLTWRFLSTWRF